MEPNDHTRKAPDGFGFVFIVQKSAKKPEQFHAPGTQNPATIYPHNFGVIDKLLLPEPTLYNRNELEKIMTRRAIQIGLPEGHYILQKSIGGPGKRWFKRRSDLKHRGGSRLLGEIEV